MGIISQSLRCIQMMILFLLMVNVHLYQGNEIDLFDNILSDEVKEEFDKYPLIRKVSRPSEWCEGVQEVEEVREIDGVHYSKTSFIDIDESDLEVFDEKSEVRRFISKRPLLNCFKQEDENLVHMIRPIFLEQDSSLPYNLSTSLNEFLESRRHDEFDLSVEMEQFYLKDIKNGFFVEAGAAEGEADSHTLLFESKHNWTGLLVEPSVNGLEFKRRKSKIAFTCLATENRPHYVQFEPISTIKLENDLKSMAGIVTKKTKSSIEMQCIPLFTLLLALDNPTVNWFILDIEGAEFQVLKTIPWTLVDIEMISVETDLAGLIMDGSRDEIIEFMRQNGYIHREHRKKSSFKNVAKDDLFIRHDIAKKLKLIKEEL